MDCTPCCRCCCFVMDIVAPPILNDSKSMLGVSYETSQHCNNYNLGFCRLESCQYEGTPIETMEISETFHANHTALPSFL